ncbi:hypothetical protein [Nocardioides marmorisolisilvae]|uniref:Glycosyltransferase RgtA/B/C/D-like domain-containing protein n=1 Tax=Nocardioides marmorisolisilvae TaxID=1542737 RepID=A0A3N0DTP8_9ACTN|nr:hypothetical protein [Nocardioides marmorisolisilvae]RNL78998.1 hypothetical protein EFL95_08100 [Nocardioides marmorisolisilvae]
MPTSTPPLSRAAWSGLLAAMGLVALAMAVPAITGWDVHVKSFPPLHAVWDPRLGPGTAPAVLVALLGLRYAATTAATLSWGRLLAVAWVSGLAWMLSLALVDGRDGIGVILQTPYEYLRTARATTDLHHTLQEYVSRIPFSAAPDNWPVHIAGHPPGALTFFVLLVHLGLGSGLAAGLVVTALAATTAPAVLVTVRRLGAEDLARTAAPFLVLGPAAIWQCVSADAMFAAVAAWGLAALAFAATSTGGRLLGWSVLAGLLLGYAVMLSYGLPLLGILALAVLILGRSWRPLLPTAAAAAAVVLTYAALGFNYLAALHALHGRYWDGVAHVRPTGYWLWGDLAALTCSAGLILGAIVAVAWARRSERTEPAPRVVLVLAAAAATSVLAADASLMSKAEVERIWLPFVPWLLLGSALLPPRWRSGGLALQVGTALLLQHLLRTGW